MKLGVQTYAASLCLLASASLHGASAVPRISAITSVADGQPVLQAAAFEVLALTGTNLATTYSVPSGTELPTSVGGTQVIADGLPCPLLFVSGASIVFQTLSAPPKRIHVVNSGGSSNSVTLTPVAVDPHLYTQSFQGGVPTLNLYNLDAGAAQGSAISPLAINPTSGANVLLYAAGLGTYNVTVTPGQTTVGQPLPHAVSPLTITIDSAWTLTPAPGQDDAFAGTFLFAGEYQIKAMVPPGVTPGFHVLHVTDTLPGSNEQSYAFFTK